MAASEPASNVHYWTDEPERSSSEHEDTKTLEMGMAGISLVSSYSGGGPERKETESTIESSSPRDNESYTMDRQTFTQPPADVSQKGSAPSSPSNGGAKGISRPPGINAAPMPSPIGKPGHSKTTSATSPLLTLTPNSSVDGNSDWHSLGTRQSSPFQGSDAPSLPFLTAEHRRGAPGEDGFGSFDLGDDNGNDGLLGLEALRERAHSSPGHIRVASASPPPIARGHLPAHGAFHPEPQSDKPRIVTTTRDRPPLSYSHQEGSSTHGERGFPSSLSSNRSVGSVGSMGSMEGTGLESTSLGTIGRPELRQAVSDFDPNRRRAASNDYQQPYGQGIPQQDPTQKFGTLPTLTSHIQQQRMYDNMSDLERPRHVRSQSQPMPANQIPAGMDGRFYQSVIQMEGHSYSGESKFGSSNRTSMSYPALSSSFDANQYNSKRVSMPNLAGHGYGSNSYGNLQRREALDWQMSPGQLSDDIRSYGTGTPSMISPGHSPMQTYYGGHSRQASDAGSGILSASPRSMPMVNAQGHLIHRRTISAGSGGDEDLTHPLVGESIDVPGESDAYGNPYGLSQSLPQMARSSSHGHSLSSDQLPPPFIDAHMLPPTAGASLPMPKVVYSVKFKRTQRNFVLGPRINRDLKVGTYVKVEADRGEDLGIVVGKVAGDKYSYPGRSSFTAGLGPSPGSSGDLKSIIRLATHDEVSLLSIKRQEEDELLEICRAKVRQRGLPMHVVDAEYQFDRHKLTFFFEAEGRVDFRELVRDLFSMYKTRIWMQQLDKNTSTRAAAIVAPPSNLQMDFGTPIIAPVSEFADSIVPGSM